MTIGRRARIDRAVQLQVLADGAGRRATDQLWQGHLKHGWIDFTGSMQIHIEAERLCNPDRIADLDGALPRQACGDNILGKVAAGIGCRPIDLGRIFA